MSHDALESRQSHRPLLIISQSVPEHDAAAAVAGGHIPRRRGPDGRHCRLTQLGRSVEIPTYTVQSVTKSVGRLIPGRGRGLGAAEAIAQLLHSAAAGEHECEYSRPQNAREGPAELALWAARGWNELYWIYGRVGCIKALTT